MNTTEQSELLRRFYASLREQYLLSGISATLEWDLRTMAPPKGAVIRGAQLEYLAARAHERATAPEFVALVDELYSRLEALAPSDQVNVREKQRMISRQTKLPVEFVAERSRTENEAYEVWHRARPSGDFAAVAPLLQKLIDLNRQECELVGYQEHPYDALLDLYEPGATISSIKPLLLKVADQLRSMLGVLTEKLSGVAERTEMVFPEELQHRLGLDVAAALGFDTKGGRLDKSAHPFATGLGEGDVRITTRYEKHWPWSSLFGVIHETGHALYEQGLLAEHAGTPMGRSVSLGIHESQSRFYENMIGRSREFSIYLAPLASRIFGISLSPDQLWRTVNQVRPSLIRVEADEVSYSLHVVIRMLLEERIASGELNALDLPAAWDDLYYHYLGIRAPSPKDGVMQDVHWYQGAFGYFPTYALGNLFAAQLLAAMERDLPTMWQGVALGDFVPILDWLRRSVHRRGMQYPSLELVQQVTGEPLTDRYFIEYLRKKFAEHW